jgi:hypothetical protein
MSYQLVIRKGLSIYCELYSNLMLRRFTLEKNHQFGQHMHNYILHFFVHSFQRRPQNKSCRS